MKSEFPVVKGKMMHWPAKAICPVCKKSKVFEPHSFAVLAAGALMNSRQGGSAASSDDMEGFLTVYWHGAHDGGLGRDPEICAVIDIFRDVQGGQGEAYFCSTACLRRFLSRCVDALEGKMDTERNALRKSRAGAAGKRKKVVSMSRATKSAQKGKK